MCDVVSFNVYKTTLDTKEWAFADNLNKPCIIGEFHFGALDRGMFHTGLVPTPSQQRRAQAYLQYVQSVADNPNFVGCHWFQYLDEPLTGRVWDGENYNIGLVDITDTPYPELTTAAAHGSRDGLCASCPSKMTKSVAASTCSHAFRHKGSINYGKN